MENGKYEAALPGREAFCIRDVSHQCLGAEILGQGKQNLNMLRKFVGNMFPGIYDSLKIDGVTTPAQRQPNAIGKIHSYVDVAVKPGTTSVAKVIMK